MNNKILLVFLDMVRPNRLYLFNKENKKSAFDLFFENLGGQIYTNAYTPSPDTPRSNGVLFTGKPPNLNGCDSRYKWPRFHLKNIETIFDLIPKDYQTNILIKENEYKNGLLPKKINANIFFNKYDFFKNHDDNKKSFDFISLPDLHYVIDDIGANTIAEKKGYRILSELLNEFSNKLNFENYNQIIFYSDHGYKLSKEIIFGSKLNLINQDRTNVFLLHKNKNDKSLSFKNDLISLEDLFSLFNSFFNDFQFKLSRKYIVFEDYSIFYPNQFMQINLWGLKTQSLFYSTDGIQTIKKIKNNIKPCHKVEIENIISTNSPTFKNLLSNYKNINNYRSNIKNHKHEFYSNGEKRYILKGIIKKIISFLF